MTGICLLLPHDAGGAGGRRGRATIRCSAARWCCRPRPARWAARSTIMAAGSRATPRSARRSPTSWSPGSTIAIAEPLAESRAAIDGLKAAKPSTRRELYRRLERARGFLHDHDDRNVTLAEMASVAGLSQFHLARYFKSAFGALADHLSPRPEARPRRRPAPGRRPLGRPGRRGDRLFGPGRAQPRLPPPLRRPAAALDAAPAGFVAPLPGEGQTSGSTWAGLAPALERARRRRARAAARRRGR